MDAGPTTAERARPTLAGRPPHLNLLMVASEVAPWVKTGGLGDVVAGLPDALDRLGHRVTSVVPLYRGVMLPTGSRATHSIRLGQTVHEVTFHLTAVNARRRVVFVESPGLFDRPGVYGERGQDYPDNNRRFAVLARAALEFAEQDGDGEPFDVVHAHDWQAGLVPALLRLESTRWTRLARAGLVFTIHNLAYQGLFPRDSVPSLGLPWEAFRLDTGEFWGQFSFLKTGIAYSDFVTTVSPTYARETLRPEFGCGMEGVLHALDGRYLGILNGIDSNVWNPATDPWLPANYDVNDLTGKLACKRELLERFRLQVGDDVIRRPIIGMVSRLAEQKGLDLVHAAMDTLLGMDATWVFVGTGDPRYEEALKALANQHPARVGVFIGFDDGLAHLVEAGADMFLMPSKFEPCGLNQMYSLRYGTVPIVHAVGGLDDTIQPHTARARHANGFKFRDATPESLVRTMRQAIRLYQDREAWRQLIHQGMTEDHSWRISAREYVECTDGLGSTAPPEAGPDVLFPRSRYEPMASEHIQTFTDGNFDTGVLKASTPVLVDFWAEWCGPCRAMEPAINALATDYVGKVSVGKLNVDDNPSITMRYMVRGIPTVMLFKGGQIVDQIVGLVDKTTLKQMLDRHL